MFYANLASLFTLHVQPLHLFNDALTNELSTFDELVIGDLVVHGVPVTAKPDRPPVAHKPEMLRGILDADAQVLCYLINAAFALAEIPHDSEPFLVSEDCAEGGMALEYPVLLYV